MEGVALAAAAAAAALKGVRVRGETGVKALVQGVLGDAGRPKGGGEGSCGGRVDDRPGGGDESEGGGHGRGAPWTTCRGLLG